MQINRRHFIRSAAMATATVASTPFALSAAENRAPVNWPVGCFNRPWTKWSYDEALTGIKEAGYKLTGLLTRTKAEPFIGADADPGYMAILKQRILDHGLRANMAALRVKTDGSVEDGINDMRKQVYYAGFLGLEFLLTFGVDKPAQYEAYYQIMADAAEQCAAKKIKLVLKPHGGGSGAAEEILRCLEKVRHPNFKIWYDAGNIIYYTGKDPVAELEPIVQHVTGFCAKDCAKEKGDVMIQFGEGKVDFKAVFARLKKAGFNGPVMVECCKIGATPEETTANARANREFLEKVFAEV